MAIFAPFAIAAKTPGFSRANRRCFRRKVDWNAGSMYMCVGVIIGEMLFGSPAFAMPLDRRENVQGIIKTVKQRLPFINIKKNHKEKRSLSK